MIITILISILGWLFVRRIFLKWKEKKIIPIDYFWKLDVLLIPLSFLPSFFSMRPFVTGIYFFIFAGAIQLIPYWVELRRRSQFEANVLIAMDVVLLSLRSGKSFRDSLSALSSKESGFGYYLREVSTFILLKQPLPVEVSDGRILRVYTELRLAEESSHRIGDRINAFRCLLKVEDTFRQKSRRAMLQARAQSLVVAVLYLLVLIFDLINFSQDLDYRIIFLSVSLFLIGTIWIWKLGRNHHWKI